ncbi:hypothetical protein AMTR_s00053p00227690, partial [Amborella trichopoda]
RRRQREGSDAENTPEKARQVPTQGVVVDNLGVLEEIHYRTSSTKLNPKASKLGEDFGRLCKGSRDVWQGFLHHQVRPEGRPRHSACTSRGPYRLSNLRWGNGNQILTRGGEGRFFLPFPGGSIVTNRENHRSSR